MFNLCFFFARPTDRPTITRDGPMGNETLYWDGLNFSHKNRWLIARIGRQLHESALYYTKIYKQIFFRSDKDNKTVKCAKLFKCIEAQNLKFLQCHSEKKMFHNHFSVDVFCVKWNVSWLSLNFFPTASARACVMFVYLVDGMINHL